MAHTFLQHIETAREFQADGQHPVQVDNSAMVDVAMSIAARSDDPSQRPEIAKPLKDPQKPESKIIVQFA